MISGVRQGFQAGPGSDTILRRDVPFGTPKEAFVKHLLSRLGVASTVVLAAALTVAPLTIAAPAGDDAQTAAVVKAKDAAKAWLALTDTGKYAMSWDQAAAFFQAAVSKTDWEKALASVRTPLGSLKTRTAKAAQFTRTLPGAPDGEYVVMQFDTSFEKKAEAVETVTTMKEKGGSWKIAGYFIK
jgi:Protein of unknown function (DUF4019)